MLIYDKSSEGCICGADAPDDAHDAECIAAYHAAIEGRASLRSIAGGKSAEEAEVHAAAMDDLRAILRRLEQGEHVTGYAIVVTLKDGEVCTQYHGEQVFSLLGGLAWLKQRLLDKVERL